MPSDSTVFVDTNVLLYAFDDRDPRKQVGARQWLTWCWVHERGRISTQVINEFYANALRKFTRPLPIEKARNEVRRLWTWRVSAVDQDTAQAAWGLQDRYSLGYWDALMLAAAVQQGCGWMLTEDLQHEQSIDGVRILNPFVVGPDRLDVAA